MSIQGSPRRRYSSEVIDTEALKWCSSGLHSITAGAAAVVVNATVRSLQLRVQLGCGVADVLLNLGYKRGHAGADSDVT